MVRDSIVEDEVSIKLGIIQGIRRTAARLANRSRLRRQWSPHVWSGICPKL